MAFAATDAWATVMAHGRDATAFQTLGAGFHYFPFERSFVAFRALGNAWVAAGAPVGPQEEREAAAHAFLEAARAAGKRASFANVPADFVESLGATARALSMGAEPGWEPPRWPGTLAAHRNLREQLRRARAKGVRIRPASAQTGALRELLLRWQATRAMPPMRFLVQASVDDEVPGRRWYLAEREGRCVGLACVIPVPRRRGWFIEHLLRDPSAPNGTPELLFDAVIRAAALEGCEWLTTGLAPLAGNVSPALRRIRGMSRGLYDFEGLARFKAKLQPTQWEPRFLVWPHGRSAFRAWMDLLAAFTPRGLLGFAVHGLVRGPLVVLRLLTWALAAWTVLLGTASPVRWFAGHTFIQRAWTAFDAVLFLGLWMLVRRPRARWASVLAVAVTADVVLTAWEASLWNVSRIRNVGEACVVGLACLAPLLGAAVLWGASTRLRRIEGAAPLTSS